MVLPRTAMAVKFVPKSESKNPYGPSERLATK
jgi:hypothetical protein